MIRHDMSTCILCTAASGCEDIQVVGVSTWAAGGATEIIVGADGDPDKAGCPGRRVRADVPDGRDLRSDAARGFGPRRYSTRQQVRRMPYCGVGCQVDLHVNGRQWCAHSPDIELDTPNQGPPA